MADGWIRSAQTNQANSGFFGSAGVVTLQPGQTLLRGWWNIGLFYLDADVTVYPPGSSVLRAGLVYAAAGLDPLDRPTPVTNANADWLAITSINPYGVQLSRAVNVAWQLNWGFPIDQSIKSQRKNDTEDDMTLYLCWEFALDGEVSGFTINGWWASLDAYVRTP